MTEPIDADANGWKAPHELTIEAYGVRVAIGASDQELFERVASVLPPGAIPVDPGEVRARFVLTSDNGVFRVLSHRGADLRSADVDIATGMLDSMVRSHLALYSPDRIFVHAGVVAHEGRALVLPGPSLSGKTTLVSALVRAGAVYYSEEYAVLDRDGLVHPYPKPLSIREVGHPGPALEETPVEAIGGVTGVEPVAVGLIAIAPYVPGARWNPRALSAGEGILRLLANTIPAIERPAEAMAAARNAIPRTILEGERGDADETASVLLQAVRTG